MQRGQSSRTQISLAALALFLILGATGCSTFNRDWKAAAVSPDSANGIEGRWLGTWLSEVNGHTGQLRCLISKQTAGRYQARFHAKYRKILSFGYTVELSATETGGTNIFQGYADLGWYAGGEYHYEGRATPARFSSTYSSKADHGTFEMTRPPLPPAK